MTKTRTEKKLLEKLNKMDAKIKFKHPTIGGIRQSRVLVEVKGKYFEGIAVLSKKDNFNRKIGRVVSLGRAFKNIEADVTIIPDEGWRIKDVV